MGFAPRTLGSTGLTVGPLGLGSSFGIGGEDVEWAFDRGCNYLYWGSLRRRGFGRALRHLLATRRDDVVLVLQSYMRWGAAVRLSFERGLRRLRADHADVLLLGMWNKPVSPAVLETALRLREQGKVRFVAVSTHQRSVAGRHLAGELDGADVLHVRYNAAHRGAEQDVFPHGPAERDARPGMVCFTATRWGSLLKPIPGMTRTPTAGDCYRFVLSRPEVDVCLAGPRDRADLEAALDAISRGPMDEEELAFMREVGDAVYTARGGRGETGFLQR
ncbi:MAG: aldo-keto reductase family protein [Planctomycetota bacterium]|jgi:aryl-alcohol dehydrogenase-like predicted oxidoreductase